MNPEMPIYNYHPTSGLNKAELMRSELTRHPLYILLTVIISPSAVVAFHNERSDFDMMGISLYNGKIID